MTKKEYMRALEEKLRLYPSDFQQEILEAFEGHFEEGLSSGESEEEIIDSLGSVDEVMDNIRMMHIGRNSNDDSRERLHSSLNSLSSSLRDTIRGVSSLVSESVSSAIREINVASEGFEESEGTADTAPGASLLIRGHAGSLDVFLESGSRLEYHYKPTKSLLSSFESKLTVEKNDEIVSMQSDGSGHLYIKVPDEIRNIEIALNSGDVEIEKLEIERIYGKTISGDWDVDDCRIESLMLSTKSGDIDLDDVLCMNMELSSMSGDLNLRNTTGNAVISTVSGEIDLDGHKGSLVKAETASGDIDARLISAEIYLTSVSGDVELYSEGRIEAVTLSTASGDIMAEIEDTDYTAQLYTVTGDVSNHTRLPSAKRSKREWIVGDGLASVNIKSTSGSLRLQ